MELLIQRAPKATKISEITYIPTVGTQKEAQHASEIPPPVFSKAPPWFRAQSYSTLRNVSVPQTPLDPQKSAGEHIALLMQIGIRLQEKRGVST